MEPLPGEDQLDFEVLDALAGVFSRLIGEAERLAKEYEVPAFFLKALHLLDGPLAMKELGGRMHCDPSFVTGIADMLEKRGLAVREPDPADRRVKRLVLTESGCQFKQRFEQEMLARLPMRNCLTRGERVTLLSLLHKMAQPISVAEAPCPAEEVTGFLANAATPPAS
jgi:DNA-binding MarR family transcriptional regulator